MIKIFLTMKLQYIKTEMEYRFNFFMMLVSGVLTKLVGVAVPFVIYANIPSVAGWKREEVCLIMAFLFVAEGLCSVLFQGIWEIPDMVFNGRFDSVLSRPVSPLFQVLSYGMGLQGISVFGFGAAAVLYFLAKLGILNIKTALLSVAFCFFGTVLCMSIYLIGNSLVFWYDSGGSTNVPYTIANIGQYARYPIEIYSKAVQFVLLFIIPYAFICVIPAQAFRGGNTLIPVLSQAGISFLFFFIARFIFYRGIRRYESMGM